MKAIVSATSPSIKRESASVITENTFNGQDFRMDPDTLVSVTRTREDYEEYKNVIHSEITV